jgi:tRNA_anti-like
MTPKTRKIIFTAVIAIIAVTAVSIYMVWNKPHKNVADADAVKVTAVDLYNGFITDSAMANARYADKVVLVSGEVNQVSQNQQLQQIILIKTAVNGASINCTMEGKTASCKTGDKISIKGICSGYISGDADMGLPGDVFLVRGYLYNEQ